MLNYQALGATEIGLFQKALGSVLPQSLNVFEALLLILISLALMFAGRRVIKVLAFLAVGLVLGAVGAVFGTLILGFVGTFIGGLVGFIFGGVLSLVLLPVGIGFGVGLVAYDLSLALIHSFILAIIMGIVFFAIGVTLSSKLLSLATAIFGGLLFLKAVTFFGLPFLIALILTLLLAASGFWIQESTKRRWAARYPPHHNLPNPV